MYNIYLLMHLFYIVGLYIVYGFFKIFFRQLISEIIDHVFRFIKKLIIPPSFINTIIIKSPTILFCA